MAAAAMTGSISGAALTAADSFDGGTGNDTVYLKGDYSGGLVLGATTLSASRRSSSSRATATT